MGKGRKQEGLRFCFNHMMQEMLPELGVSEQEIAGLAGRIERAAKNMDDKRGVMAWRDLPYSQKDVVEEIKKTAQWAKENFDYFVLLGIGGSALGPLAVHRALNPAYYNDMDARKRGGPKIYIEDNIDPERMQALLDVIDAGRTLFYVVSKSGATSETMAQMMVITQLLHALYPEGTGGHVIMATDAKKGNLNIIAKREGNRTFVIPEGVGGRFSELCPVGLLPAAIGGIDIEALLEGAAQMDARCTTHDVWKNPAYLGAVLQLLYMRKGRNISVMMPYIDALKYVADWYAQLWAESLGKRVDLDGREVFAGQTPVKALGVTDQHSQLQLYTEGPQDKVVTFIGTDAYRNDVYIPNAYPDIDGISFLGGHTLGELIKAEQASTEYALWKAGRPSQTIWLPEISANTIGQLLYYFEVQTAFAGELLNIDAFNQPGVEEGKNATYAMLGKPGYEEKKAELNKRKTLNQKYVL
ncbi:MAG: glucose-6-phosphate isomerase [Bacillota bacterium]